MRKFTTIVPVLILAVFAFAVTGCGKKVSDRIAESAMEKAMAEDGNEADVQLDSKTGSMTIKSKDGDKDVEVNIKDGGMTIKSKDGEVMSMSSKDGETFTMKTADGKASVAIGKGAKIPDNFPKDVPVYAGIEINMASADPAGQTFSIQAMSDDPPEKIAEFYKKEMKANGWVEAQGMVTTGGSAMHMLNFEKGDNTAAIIVMAQEGKTSLSIATGKN